MTDRYDVIVVGVGAMGSATCYELARRGRRVLGLERLSIPNAAGSHHGQSRVVRKAYFEHPDYVPLLQRAYEKWAEIEAVSGRRILHRTGGFYMGPPAGELIAGSLLSMRKYGLPHEELSRDEVAARHPQFRVPEGFVGLSDPDLAFAVPEAAVAAYADRALRDGAELHGHEPVTAWRVSDRGVTVTTPAGTYEADRLVLCAGAWSDRLLRGEGDVYGLPRFELTVTRQVMAWVWPGDPEPFAYGRLPVWVIDAGGGGVYYGFPMMPDRPGLKLALHRPADPTDPDAVSRTPTERDFETFRPCLAAYLPQADGPLLSLEVCLYTNSPDGHFVIDRHPDPACRDRVVIACGFSGHGFKFVSVVGEALADLATVGRTELPIGFLGVDRFATPDA